MVKKLTSRQEAWQGGKWITPLRRLAIYLRDGLACVYCGDALEDGAQLSLDHLKCHSQGGGNESCNLATACKRCNSSRGDRSVREFCRAVAVYLNHGVDPKLIENRVRAAARRKVPVEQARELIARRGNLSGVMSEIKAMS